MPVHLFVGTADWLASPEDTVDKIHIIPSSEVYVLEDFDHLDFIWGKTAITELHPKILNILTPCDS